VASIQDIAKGANIAAGYGRVAASVFPNSSEVAKVSGLLDSAANIADALAGGGIGALSGAGIAKPKKMSEVLTKFGKLAGTSHYEVAFSGFMRLSQLSGFLMMKGVDILHITRDAGILCSSASLPGSAYATTQITSNFPGITENIAYTRTFAPIDFTFYVDQQYKNLKFFEHWMEYISSGADQLIPSKASPSYFNKFKYPNGDGGSGYKCDSMSITKFDRDYRSKLVYNFIGAFPVNIAAIPVSYEGTRTLQVTVTFSYDRYVCGPISSAALSLGSFSNFIPSLGSLGSATGGGGGNKLVPVRGNSGVVFYDSSKDTRTSAEVSGRFFGANGSPTRN